MKPGFANGKQDPLPRRRITAQERSSRQYTTRRSQILQAASVVFRKRGYESTSLANIAHELNMDRSTVYYYFRSKDEIFHELVSDIAKENVRRLESAVLEDASASEKLTLAVDLLMDSYEEHHNYIYLFFDFMQHSRSDADMKYHLKDLVNSSKRYEELLSIILDEGRKDGELQYDGPPMVIAYGILGMVNWTSRWFDPSNHISAAEIAEAYIRLVLDGLRSGPRSASEAPLNSTAREETPC